MHNLFDNISKLTTEFKKQYNRIPANQFEICYILGEPFQPLSMDGQFMVFSKKEHNLSHEILEDIKIDFIEFLKTNLL
jgi:hypothetical protein